MTQTVIRLAQVGYGGMFGSDMLTETMWDVQRNGIAPYLDRLGLDDFCKEYQDIVFEMVAIGTPTQASAEQAVRKNETHTGRRPAAYYGETPWDDILQDHPDVDVLLVATPDHLHTEPILAALNNGTHVIVQKCLCLDLNEADTIIETAQEKSLIVGVERHKRYDPDHQMIFHELIPRLGTPIYARGLLEEPLEVSTEIFEGVEQSDPFTYVGVYWVDFFMHYLDLTPLALYGIGQKQRLIRDFGKDTFDAVQIMVTHTSGMTIIYEHNWITPKEFEGRVNQESQILTTLGKVESDTQYRGLRYWSNGGESRTTNTHSFRHPLRPDGSQVSLGYGKDSQIVCLEKVCRIRALGATAADLAGTYPDAASQRLPTAVIQAAWHVVRRNFAYAQEGKPPVVTARFGVDGTTLDDPNSGESVSLYAKPI